MDDERLFINDQVSIPRSELRFRFSRSSGPGGQHAQKTSTRVELLFDVAHSPSLSESQRAQVLRRLQGYVDGEGVLRLVAQSERSQRRNREEVIARFQRLMQAALKRRKRRRPSRPSAAAQERRLRAKRRRSEIKKLRRPVRTRD